MLNERKSDAQFWCIEQVDADYIVKKTFNDRYERGDVKTPQDCFDIDMSKEMEIKNGDTILILGFVNDDEYDIVTFEEDAILYNRNCDFMFIKTQSGKYYTINCEPAIIDYNDVKQYILREEAGFETDELNIKMWNIIKNEIEKYNITKYIMNPA